MLKQIVTQVSGHLTALFFQALALLKALVCKPVSYLRAKYIQISQNARNFYLLNLLRVPTGSNINLLRVNLITVGQLIKAALISVKVNLLQIGSLLLTIARQIRQLVPTAQSPRKGKPVGITKSARSPISVSKTAQTNTVSPLIQDGLKYQGRAKRHRQRVKQPLKAKP
jgi:hypothetical protein